MLPFLNGMSCPGALEDSIPSKISHFSRKYVVSTIFFKKTNYFDGSLNAVWNNSKITRPRTKSNLNIFVILAEDVQQEIFSQVSRWRETSIVLHDKQTFPLLSLSWSHTIKTANHINDIQQHIHHASHPSFILMGQFPVFNDTVSLREHS